MITDENKIYFMVVINAIIVFILYHLIVNSVFYAKTLDIFDREQISKERMYELDRDVFVYRDYIPLNEEILKAVEDRKVTYKEYSHLYRFLKENKSNIEQFRYNKYEDELFDSFIFRYEYEPFD